MDERNFIIFSNSKSTLKAIWGRDWIHRRVPKILERLHRLEQYQEKRILSYYTIHPKLGLWPGGFRVIRCVESVLAGICIGHSHMTHSFLLTEEDPPRCIACDCHLTVRHFI